MISKWRRSIGIIVLVLGVLCAWGLYTPHVMRTLVPSKREAVQYEPVDSDDQAAVTDEPAATDLGESQDGLAQQTDSSDAEEMVVADESGEISEHLSAEDLSAKISAEETIALQIQPETENPARASTLYSAADDKAAEPMTLPAPEKNRIDPEFSEIAFPAPAEKLEVQERAALAKGLLSEDLLEGMQASESEAPAPQPEDLSAEQPSVVSAWPHPAKLIEELQGLSGHSAANAWAEEVLSGLERLQGYEALGTDESAQTLHDLQATNSKTSQLAKTITPITTRIHLLRTSYSLTRRLTVWRSAQRVAAHERHSPAAVKMEIKDLKRQLSLVESIFRDIDLANAWRDYLLLDELSAQASQGEAADPRQQRLLARQILKRLESPAMTRKQIKFLDKPAIHALSELLGHWATEPVSTKQLLANLELFEQNQSGTVAGLIAENYQLLRWSPESSTQALAKEVETHYRNANARLLISSELINQLLPEIKRFQEDVDDEILGAIVTGTSNVATRLRVQLLPDANAWRVGFEVHGQAASRTTAVKGSASFHSDGAASFFARKLFVADSLGVRLWPAEGNAAINTTLTGIDTGYDSFPIFGAMAQSIAQSEHDNQSFEAKQEAESLLSKKTRRRLDQEVDRRLIAAENEIQHKLMHPLESIDLVLSTKEMKTTAESLVARYQVAQYEQLAAHTPRPQAPKGSLLELQIHQSAFNNFLQQLELDGKRYGLRELYLDLAKKMGLPAAEAPQTLPEGVFIQFADRDAVSVSCENGRVQLRLKIAELSNARKRKWKNFVVQSYYRPDIQHLDARLVRDGHIELYGNHGKRLRLIDQLALRGIFIKVFSVDRSLHLIPQRIALQPKLSELKLTQFLVRDGWICASLGPKKENTALAKKEQAASARK